MNMRPAGRRTLIQAGSVIYGFILVTQVLTVYGVASAGNLLPLASVTAILIECAILFMLCVTQDHRQANAGWVALGISALAPTHGSRCATDQARRSRQLVLAKMWPAGANGRTFSDNIRGT
jgi:hypothetical protein